MDNEIVLDLAMLSYDERRKVYDSAKYEILGGKEKSEKEFNVNRVNEYPKSLTYAMLFLTVILFIATFLPSAFRIYYAGSSVFCDEPNNFTLTQCTTSGVSLVLMSETAVFLFSLIGVILTKTSYVKVFGIFIPSSLSFYLTKIGILLGISMALAGNYYVVQPDIFEPNEAKLIFKLLETFGPPIMTLILAQVLEKWALSDIEVKREGKIEYNEYLVDRKNKSLYPEEQKDWYKIYGRLIWKTLQEKWIKQAQEDETVDEVDVERFINNLSKGDKAYLVRRELEVDRFDIDLTSKTVKEKEQEKLIAVKTEYGFWNITDPVSGFEQIMEYKQKKRAITEFEKILELNKSS